MARERPVKQSKGKADKGKKKRFNTDRIRKFFREISSEMKKVSWPTTKELTNYTIIVIAFIAIIATIVGVIDFFLGKILELIIR
mgnify:CR=1 FL=1